MNLLPWHLETGLPKWRMSRQAQHFVLLMQRMFVNLWGILCFIPRGLVNLLIRSFDTKTGLSEVESWVGDCVITQCIALDTGDTGTSTLSEELLIE